MHFDLKQFRILRQGPLRRVSRFSKAILCGWLGLAAFLSSVLAADDYATGLIATDPDRLKAIAPVPVQSQPSTKKPLDNDKSLREFMPPPGIQGNQKSCAAWAAVYALRSYQVARKRSWRLADRNDIADPAHTFSPAFVYNQINDDEDNGSTLVDVLEFLCKTGCSTLSKMPYDPDNFDSQPSKEAKEEASRFALRTFFRLEPQKINLIKRFLQENNPILIGANVDSSFKDIRGKQVWTQFSTAEGAMREMHALLVIGFNEDLDAFEVQNSWGPKWGDNGFGWIGYAQFKRCVMEAYFAEGAGTSSDPLPDPLAVVKTIWQTMITIGKFTKQPTSEELEHVIDNALLPVGSERIKFLTTVSLNWDEFRKVANLPQLDQWGDPERHKQGEVEKFTYKPTFVVPYSALGLKSLTVSFDFRDGRITGWGFQAKPAVLPHIEVGRPEVTQSVARNGELGVSIHVPGRLIDLSDKKAQIRLIFFSSDGPPLRAAPNEKHYKDSKGNVSTQSDTFVIEGGSYELVAHEMFVPYRAFNFRPSGGKNTCYLAVSAGIFIDGVARGSSEVVPFDFPY